MFFGISLYTRKSFVISSVRFKIHNHCNELFHFLSILSLRLSNVCVFSVDANVKSFYANTYKIKIELLLSCD
jgi:hypothetical protein